MAESASAITSSWINTERYFSDISVDEYVISLSLRFCLGQVFQREQTPFRSIVTDISGSGNLVVERVTHPKTITF
jgi:hypothetical protein